MVADCVFMKAMWEMQLSAYPSGLEWDRWRLHAAWQHQLISLSPHVILYDLLHTIISFPKLPVCHGNVIHDPILFPLQCYIF